MVQSSKAQLSIKRTLSGIVKLVSFSHPAKASCPITFNPSERITSVRFSHSSKAFSSIFTTLSGIVTDLMLQKVKALVSIFRTVDGITISSMLLPSKALLPITSVPSGIMYFPSAAQGIFISFFLSLLNNMPFISQ